MAASKPINPIQSREIRVLERVDVLIESSYRCPIELSAEQYRRLGRYDATDG